MNFMKLKYLLVLCCCLLPLLAAPVSAKTYKIATISPDGLDWMKKLREGAKEIKELTDGRVKFKIYPGGVQGDDFTVLRKMRIGQLHGGAVSASVLTRFYPDLQVYNLPLQFRNREEVDFVREQMDQRIIDGLDANGIVTFGLTETGFAYLLTKDPVASVEDLKSIKAWVPSGDPVSSKIVRSFGISPIPLPITDVLAGLQTGLVDAVVVPPLVALALQWHNHVKFVTDLPLLYVYSMLAMDKKAFGKMSPEDQVIVHNVFGKVFKSVDTANRIDNVKAYEALLTQGIKAVTPDTADIDVWLSRAQISIDELVATGELSQESLDLLLKYLGTVRANEVALTGE